jgi:hypothetical protein
MACNSGQELAPNPRLQLTRAALPLLSHGRCVGKVQGDRRAQLKRQPLGVT